MRRNESRTGEPMSRRLVLLVSAVAAAMGELAYADPGCFGPSCRMTPQALMPALQDPPRLVLDAQSMDATGNLVDVTPPPITEGRARASHSGAEPAASTKPVPETAQTAIRPEKNKPAVTAGPAVNSAVPPMSPKGAKPVPRVAEGSPAEEQFQQRIRQIQRLRQEPVRTRPVEQAQSWPEQTLPVRSPESRRSKPDSGPDSEVAREPRRVRVVRRGPESQVQVAPPAPPVRIEAQIGGEVIIVSQPDAFDNRWRRCQIARDGHPVRCSPASYHPYGSGGYRPYGDYRAYAPTPGYIRTAPGPRIISIVTD